MNATGSHLLNATVTEKNELTPTRISRLRRLRRYLSRQRNLTSLTHAVAAPGALLVALTAAVTFPLPTHAARLGTGWSERISGGTMAGNTVPLQQFTAMHVAFKGSLAPSVGRTTVTLVIQILGAHTTTMGMMVIPARRVFNTQPIALPSLFSMLGVAAHPSTLYRISVQADNQTLTSATMRLAQ